MQVPTVLSILGAVLICVSTFSLGAFERTHPQPSTSPDPSIRDGHNLQDLATHDGMGAYSALPSADAADPHNGART